MSKRISKAAERARERLNTPEDDFVATLHQQLQETGQQVLRLQQAMRPQTPAQVCGAYVKGTLVNLTQQKFEKACKDISRILEVVMHVSDEEASPGHECDFAIDGSGLEFGQFEGKASWP